MNRKEIVCFKCKQRSGLYKKYMHDGKFMLYCFKCKAESLPYEYHEDLETVPDVHELVKDWS